MHNHKNIAIIPARGGSKRIPGKNIKQFLGKPIIEYSINAALETSLFDTVIVSTDDIAVKEIAVKSGAKVPFLRSQKNSNDFAIISDVLMEVIAQLEESGQKYEYICCLYPTAPFVTSKKLEESYNLLLKTGASGVISVVKYSSPIQRALRIDADKRLFLINKNFEKVRSQDLEPAYYDAGQFFWLRVSDFLKNNEIFSNNLVGYIVDQMEARDIDSMEDWKEAEIKFKYLQDNS